MAKEPKSKTYHHGNLRNALIAAGLEIVTQEGFAELDLRKVARKAGVSHAAPYRHFADKEALLAAICEEGFEQLNMQLEQAFITINDDLEVRLLQFTRIYVNFSIENGALVREMLGGLFVDYQRYPSLVAAMQVAPQLLAKLITPHAKRFTSTLMFAINGLTLECLKGSPIEPEAVDFEIRQLIGIVYGGLIKFDASKL